MASKMSKDTKPKHRPSRTPTGLPGDTPKQHRYKRQRDKLGDLVDNLLVPEHKAARRLIRRSQRKNPDMSTGGANMTLYERIMAYRHLKDAGGSQGESKDGSVDGENRKLDRSDVSVDREDRKLERSDDSVDREDRKLERSETSWGSVDISHYTNKVDSDDNRSPTPPPTLTQPVGSRRPKQGYENSEPATARDVHVDIDDPSTVRDRLPPVRSTTPKNPGTPSPSRDKIMSSQGSDINKHTVLPPIHDAKLKGKAQGRSKDDDDVEVERIRQDTVAATTVYVGKNEKRNEKTIDSEKKEEFVKRNLKDEVKKVMAKEKNDERKTELHKSIHDDKEHITKETRKQYEKIENKNDETVNYRDSRKIEGKSRHLDHETQSVKEENHQRKESKTPQKDNSWQNRTVDESDDENNRRLRDVAAQVSPLVVKTPSPAKQSRKPRSPFHNQEKSETEPEFRRSKPASSPSQQKSQNDPESRRSKPKESPPKQTRAFPEIPEKSPWFRNRSKRKSSLDEEIERLDKIVDRDLNEIIRTLGNKSRNLPDNDMDSKLKEKVLNPTFQAGIDKYLRDI